MNNLDLPGVPTGLSTLVLGTMTFGDTVDLPTARRMVDVCLDAGITALDTANGYAGTRSEEMLAGIIAGRRDRINLATKAGIYPGDAGDAPLLSELGLQRSLDASLGRLGVDVIDVFYLHQPDRSVAIDETLGALAGLRSDGKIRAYGVSNYSAWQIADITRFAAAAGMPPPALAQQLYNLVARRIEDEYVEFALAHQVPTIVYNPLGGGLLTGRHRLGEPPGAGRFGTSGIAAMYRDRYWNEATFDAVERLAAIAAGFSVSLPALAPRWLLSKPVVSAVLLGGSKVEQLEEIIAAGAEGSLPDDVVAECDAVTAPLRGSMPAYNR